MASAVSAAAAGASAKAVGGLWNHSSGGIEFEGTAFDCECFCIDQRVGDIFVGGFEDSAERLARYVHLFGGLLLIEALKVGQADCFELING